MDLNMTVNDRSSEIGENVSRLVKIEVVSRVIAKAREQAAEILNNDLSKPAGTVPISLDAFGAELPGELRSCRISIMRGGTAYHIERHTNACQYVYSLENSGAISVFDGSRWETTLLVSDTGAPLSARWHTVPMNTWHQPVPGERDWVVLGFHTVSSEDLIDDYFEGQISKVKKGFRV
jgi:hypothetical protein